MSKFNILQIIFFSFLYIIIGCSNSHSPKWKKLLNYQTEEFFPITIGKYGYPYISVKINTQEYKLPWDTGNMNKLVLSTRLINQLSLPVLDRARSYDSGGNIIGEYRVLKVEKFILFNEIYKDIKAFEFSNDNLPGLIGPGFIINKRFTIDYLNKIIAVSSSPLPTKVFDTTHPMVHSSRFPELILVYGYVNNQKVLLEIDTGKSRTIVDPELAYKLNLPKTSNGYRIDEIKIGEHSFEVPTAKLKSFKGISDGLPEKIRLSIGSDILSKIVLSVDYPNHVLGIINN